MEINVTVELSNLSLGCIGQNKERLWETVGGGGGGSCVTNKQGIFPLPRPER